MKTASTLLMLIAFLCLVFALARADLGWVAFKAGGAIESPVHEEGNEVVLDLRSGPLRFARDQVRAVRPGISDADEWSQWRDRAIKGNVSDQFAATWWAIEHGLTAEAEQMLRTAHAHAPDHQPTGRLVALLDQLSPPCPDPEIEAIRSSLPGRFEIARGPHVLLLHQTTAELAAERVALLERVISTYYLSFTAYGLDLKVPNERLVFVWFSDQKNYQFHLRSDGSNAFLTTQGYYHPTKHIVLSYQLESDAIFRRRRRELALASKADRERRALLIANDRQLQEEGTIAHETIHQLVRVSGLAPRFETLPIWLHEGLAMQFEVVRGQRWAGVGRLNPVRLEAYRQGGAAPSVVSLVRDEHFGHGYNPLQYAVAWSFVYFLRKTHPMELYGLLDQLRATDSDAKPAGARALAAFEASFGANPAPLEDEWHRFIDKLRLPGEGPGS